MGPWDEIAVAVGLVEPPPPQSSLRDMAVGLLQVKKSTCRLEGFGADVMHWLDNLQ